MKIRVPNGLLTVDILTVLTLVVVAFVPSTTIRFILGIPLLMFFPGFALLSAVFVDKEMDALEKLGLSCAVSIAAVALIGFGLNYTAWGVTLWPALVAVAGLVLLASVVALVRQANSPRKPSLLIDLDLRLPAWKVNRANRLTTVALIGAVLISVGALAFVWNVYRPEEAFTDFYVLGIDGTAQDYPAEFLMEGSRTTGVRYGTDNLVPGELGRVTVVIENHEQSALAYSVAVKVDGQPVAVDYSGARISRIEIAKLEPGGEWRGTIGFAPDRVGDHQKVEILLFKDSDVEPEDSLHLWVDARPRE